MVLHIKTGIMLTYTAGINTDFFLEGTGFLLPFFLLLFYSKTIETVSTVYRSVQIAVEMSVLSMRHHVATGVGIFLKFLSSFSITSKG